MHELMHCPRLHLTEPLLSWRYMSSTTVPKEGPTHRCTLPLGHSHLCSCPGPPWFPGEREARSGCGPTWLLRNWSLGSGRAIVSRDGRGDGHCLSDGVWEVLELWGCNSDIVPSACSG
jgi:hypothetical protein